MSHNVEVEFLKLLQPTCKLAFRFLEISHVREVSAELEFTAKQVYERKCWVVAP
jgi:hypothetical protein